MPVPYITSGTTSSQLYTTIYTVVLEAKINTEQMIMAVPPPSFSLLFLLLFFFLFSISSAAQCNPSDKKVLLQIKTKLNPTNIAFSDWDPKATPDCCEWFGIDCSTSARVTSLNLDLTKLKKYFSNF